MPGKTAFLALIILSIKTSLFAQSFLGVEGGSTYNSYHTNISNRAATELSGQAGFNFFLSLRYKILPWLYVITAPGLVQKGYSMNRTDSLSGEYDQHINTYLQLPVGIGAVYERQRWRFGLDLGLYTGYWLYGHIKGQTADIFGTTGAAGEQYTLVAYNQAYSFSQQRDNRWEEGWWIGPAIQYRLTQSWWLTAGTKYYQSLTAQEKAAVSPIPAYNRTWLFSIGGVWSLPKSKGRS